MDQKWIDIIGLIFALLGAVLLAIGLIIPRKRAIKAGVSRMSDDTDEKNIYLPHVQDRLRESKYASLGVLLIIIGFILQILGNLLMP